MPKKVYVASPLGFSDAGRYFHKNYLLPRLKQSGVDVLDPWASSLDKTSAEIASRSLTTQEALEVGKLNTKLIGDSDIVVAILDGSDVDSGVAAEIGYAFGIGKRILGYRGDFRLTSETASCTVNLQIETFIRESGGRIFNNIDGLLKELSGR